MHELDLRHNHKRPNVLPTHRVFFDKIVGERKGEHFGIPGGSWIHLSGVPGSGKTLILLDVLNGLAQNKNCEVDLFDYESGKNRIVKYLKLVGSTNVIKNILAPPREALIPRIKMRCKELQEQNKFYVVAIDSINEFAGDNVRHARQIAHELHELRECPNLILITIAHLVKGSKRTLAGPAQFARLSDVNLVVNTLDVYRILSAPEKNRLATDHTEPVKIFLEATKGWQESTEPDFVTKNPIVQFLRKWL